MEIPVKKYNTWKETRHFFTYLWRGLKSGREPQTLDGFSACGYEMPTSHQLRQRRPQRPTKRSRQPATSSTTTTTTTTTTTAAAATTTTSTSTSTTTSSSSSSSSSSSITTTATTTIKLYNNEDVTAHNWLRFGVFHPWLSEQLPWIRAAWAELRPNVGWVGESLQNGDKFRLGIIWVFPKIVVFPSKWMVKIMENPIKMDDLGWKPTIFGTIHIYFLRTTSLCWC